ncbi:hypothetical protein B0J18DRAFT_473788 [Chaetomium sp. MPI-SDFR-AT-0129]|nr:hypothetical protein B0J18DRAFT_473788 [Chaetomium sp. MPI-SDFR-AT-0129]
MGKPPKQPEPLRAQPSRVEKSRPTQKDTRNLPSWYLRLLAFSYQGDREVHPWDFDEDLSELEEQDDGSKQEKENDCECGGHDPECGCQFLSDSDMDEDGRSERSYDGSDADYYYELKEEREDRKHELHWDKLFCTDHVDHFYADFYAIKEVRFRPPHNEDKPHLEELKLDTTPGLIYGQVYLDVNACFGFGPFHPPKRASRKPVKLKCCNGAKGEVSLKFLGNGYVKLRVPRELVFMGHRQANLPTPPPKTPEVFKFVGIWDDPRRRWNER